MHLKKFNLASLCDYTSKSKLAFILQCSTRTIYCYHDIAMNLEDFEADYPSITKGSKAITSAELTRYQCWVLFSLMLVCRRLQRNDVATCILQNQNPEFTEKFSRETYHQLHPEYRPTQEVIIHDYQIICTAA
jgi:hypothetical protein